MHASRRFVVTLLTLGICVPIIFNLLYANDKKGIRRIHSTVNTNGNLRVQSNREARAAINSNVSQTSVGLPSKTTQADNKNSSFSGTFVAYIYFHKITHESSRIPATNSKKKKKKKKKKKLLFVNDIQ